MCNSPKKFIPQEQRSHKKSEQQSITSDFKHKTNIFFACPKLLRSVLKTLNLV